MKKLNLLFLLLTLLATSGLKAQNQYYPWAVGFGYAAVDYYGSNGGKAFDINNFNAAGQVTVARHISSGISVLGSGHLGSLRNPIPYWKQSLRYWNLTVGAQYSFANGYILSDESPIEPYIGLGIGFHSEKDLTAGLGVLNLGLNYWVSDATAINLQASFNQSLSNATKQMGHDIYSVGLRFRIGTGKDTDGDGIIDKEDACPDKAGLPAFKGCPDTDNDGIEDAKDECPDKAGLPIFNGCPDTDSDGIKDSEDACPDKAGAKDLNGCPDSDGDGIADKDDACPTQKGAREFNGCPDSDGDGVADKDDACPTQKGAKEFNGCPDTDGDGIADKDDKCPTEKGVASQQGCPEPKLDEKKVKEVEKELEMDAKMIQFETGSAVIKKESYDDLDKISSLMKQYPSAKFAVEGHTDNVGDAKANKMLSQQRADAVKKYIAEQGVDGMRINAKGYGQEKPIANNATPAGRQQNRRVEIHVVK